MDSLERKARRARRDRWLLLGISGAQTSTDSKIDESLKELQAQFGLLKKENDEIVDSFEIKDGTVIVDAERHAKFQANVATMTELSGQMKSLKGYKEQLDWAGAPSSDPAAIAAAVVAAAGGSRPEYKSIGQRFIESDSYQELKGKGFPKGFGMSGILLEGVDLGNEWSGRKDIFSASPSPQWPAYGGFGTVERDPTLPLPQRRVRVRDLFPARPTGAAVIQYFRETGFTNAASPVAQRTGGDFTTKPKSDIAFDGRAAVVRTVAHWVAAHRDTLSDEPTLQGIVDSELLYGLRLREDQQILTGAGTGEDLPGILNDPDIQTYAWSDGELLPVPDNRADAIRRAATKVFLSNFEPTGVVVSPSDWEKIELAKDANGQYLLAVSIALGGQQRVWRMPVVDTAAMADETALVGAFGLGAQLYDRLNPEIRLAEQHAEMFVQNAVAILAEERLALAIKRPESFVKVTFDAEPS